MAIPTTRRDFLVGATGLVLCTTLSQNGKKP